MEEKKKVIINFLNEILSLYEFQLLIDTDVNGKEFFKIEDLQGGNWQDINNEEFISITDIINRLDSCHDDYIFIPLENREEANEEIPKDDWDLTAARYLRSDIIAKVLNNITPEEYRKLMINSKKYETIDMINILNEDDLFYKDICQKYVNTMSKEMLLDTKNEILHIYIQDEYIPLKEAGKIDIYNYTNYLEGNFEVEHYKFYFGLYSSVIKDNIAYDLNDLGVFDLEDEWDFYLTFEELQKIGYGYIVKDHFPLLEEYAVPEERIYDFFEHFSLEQLKEFEETLRLYYKTGKIKFDKDLGFLTSETYTFNNDILKLSCGLISYQDFMEDYKIKEPITQKEILIRKEVIKYFNENQIENMENYGADSDEGLCKISSLYSEIMDKLNIKYSDVFTEDGISGGKYIITISFDDDTNIVLDSKSRDNFENVVDNVVSISEEYEKWYQEAIAKEENVIENDYDL